MGPESFARLAGLFDQYITLSPDERQARMTSLMESEPEIAFELCQILKANDTIDAGFLESSALAETRRGESEDIPIRIGNYQVLSRIGAGGMGDVFLAVRDDGVFLQEVAIKLIKRGLDTVEIVRRFQQERQILAQLQHDNIARLLDGGSTADGRPYLVLELINGERIDNWCKQGGLSCDARIRLFLKACEAVSFAHRHLVVHRDLKPGNILVTPDGHLKLLDFGIAKLLTGSDPDFTAHALAPITPEYASPEQIAGKPVSTAFDVYSLGIVLYELLTGSRPSRERLSPLDSTRCPDVAQNRRRDLDAVLCKALEPDPELRYASVEQFADDLQRCLRDEPISARRATAAYHVRKFLHRHRLSVAVTALALLALLGTTVWALWQTARANAAQARAEDRFRETRHMANSLLFDVYDRIDERGASIPVRESIVRESIHYLDSLSRSAGNDLSLRQELALGYRRLTLLQSGPMNANKGDLPGALASSQKAIALQESVVAGSPTSTSARSLLADLYDDRAYLVKGSGDAAGARSLAGRAVQTGRDLLNSPLPEDRLHAAVLLLHASMLNRSPDVIAQGIGQLESATAILDQLETQGMKTDRFRTQRASAHKNLGAILAGIRRDFDTARRHYLTAYEIEQALVAAHPENTNLRYDLTFTESDLASIDSNQGRKSQALEAYRNVLAVRERMLANDPEDVRTKLGVANTCRNLSSLLGSVQQFPEAVQFARRAATLDAELKRQGQLDPIFSARTFRLLGDTYLAWSKSAPSQERMDKAHEYYRSALPIFRDQGAKGALVGPEVDAVKNIEASLAEIARRGN